MKTRLIPFVALVLMWTGCAEVYRCGTTVPEDFRASKRWMPVVAERDSLCTTLADTQANLAQTRDSLQHVRADLASLESDYDELRAMSDEERSQLSSRLQSAAGELSEKERLLQEREQNLRELQAVIARQDSLTNRLNEVIRKALLNFDADELSVEMKNGKVYVSMSDKLLFKSGSAAVEAKGKEALEALAGVLKKDDEIDILVEGHTDNVPIKTAVFKDNWDLSVARATAITRILSESYGVDPRRVTPSGRGEFFPKASNDSPEGRAQNRRTEIILSPRLDMLMEVLGQG